MTYYLKYRSQKLEELDIEEVRESLTKIAASGQLPHAFLFAGPKGTGKTSAARIIAKIVNCDKKGKEPCNRCESCLAIEKGNHLDVLEIDAASNRGIDDIRALREAVKLAPAKARKKVYIIDEAHMLTTEASNALLKTLEEPPAHVMFILATTNPQKLVETVRSRTSLIAFRKAKPEEVVRSLNRVVKGEKLKIGEESLLAIAETSGGSFRDGVKILEQVVVEKIKLNEADIKEFLFRTKVFNPDEFLVLLRKKETPKLISQIEAFVQKGVSPDFILSSLLTKARLALLAKVGVGEETLPDFSRQELVRLLELFSQAMKETKDAFIEQLPLELALIAWCEEEKKVVVTQPQTEIVPEKKEVEVKKTFNQKVGEVTEEIWQRILTQVKPVNTSIEALLRAARPVGFDGKTLTLGVYYRFHKERLEEGVHRRVLEEVVAGVLGSPVRVICTLTEPPARRTVPQAIPKEGVLTEGEDKDIIKIAEEIFGA